LVIGRVIASVKRRSVRTMTLASDRAHDWKCIVMTDPASPSAPLVSADAQPSIPAMPAVPRQSLDIGSPRLLVSSDVRYSLGWHDHRKAGPSFALVRLSRVGDGKVIRHFPFTEDGWTQAWTALAELDADSANAVAAALAKRAARDQVVAELAQLDADSVRCLRSATFNGGPDETSLVKGRTYDVRFLSDRVKICPPRAIQTVLELPYSEIETLQVTGSKPTRSGGEQAAVIIGLALLGGLIGLVVLGIIGFLLGAFLVGAIGALVTSSGKTEATVRLDGASSEYFFLLPYKDPDIIRIELSEPLKAIENRNATSPATVVQPADPHSEPVPDQLSKLAALLQDGLITRAEFDQLKAQVIAGSSSG
jgi:Short C-terminal domain